MRALSHLKKGYDQSLIVYNNTYYVNGGHEMPDRGTSKKITKIEGGETSGEARAFTPTAESKGQATKFRIIAVLSWLVAIGIEVFAILLLRKPPIVMWQLIALIAGALVFAVIGTLLWKKANRFDPASERDRVRFFVQNQLGAIISIIAFLPLVILIFTNKNMDAKQKGIIGSIAIVAMLAAGITGVDFNPPSQEQYAAQTARVEQLMNRNHVFWTKSGTRFHLYSDCYRINTKRTDEIFQGTVAKARELKNINTLCSTCEVRASKEKGLQVDQTIQKEAEQAVEPATKEAEAQQ